MEAERQKKAYEYRKKQAYKEYIKKPMPALSNGDERKYGKLYFASFTKGLPHNDQGFVDPNAYKRLLHAIKKQKPEYYNRIPLGGSRKLTNPQAGYGMDLEGRDSCALSCPPPPCFAGTETAGEIVENYWMALLRDVNFSAYNSSPLAIKACEDLSKLTNFKGAKVNGLVVPQTLFRTNIYGVTIGPYLSQFFFLNCPFGANNIDQKITTNINEDFMTTYDEWLYIQRGNTPLRTLQHPPEKRYMINGRDLSEWVHIDVLYQGYFTAMLILLSINAPWKNTNPYVNSKNQDGFGTLGGPNIATLVPEVSTRALKTVWNSKWNVNRRLRPEAFGERVDRTLNNIYKFPINKEALESSAVQEIYNTFGSYLLPQAYPEGSPIHPSYGAGHATVAGACVTILKAWFDEDYVLPIPMIPNEDGSSLIPYVGEQLTVGGELNKLAHNVAFGRNIAGVHWRSDGYESLLLGEKIAVNILKDQKHGYNEDFKGWKLTGFRGNKICI